MDELDLEPFSKLLRDLLVHPDFSEEDDAALADNFGSKMQAITFRGDYEELKVCIEKNPPKVVLKQFGGESVQDLSKNVFVTNIYGWLQHVMMLIWQERLSHLSKNM